MKMFSSNKISKGLTDLLKRKKVTHFSDHYQFESHHEAVSYQNHFTDAQVSEIAALSYLKK